MSLTTGRHEIRKDTLLLIKEDAEDSAKKIVEEVKEYNQKKRIKNVLKNVYEFYIEVTARYGGCSMWIGGVNRTGKRITCNIYYRKELVHSFDVTYLYQETDFFCNIYVDQLAKELKKQGYRDFKFFKQDLLGFKARRYYSNFTP